MIPDIRKRTDGFGDLVGPVDAVGHVVFVSAGNTAGTTPDAPLQINNHGISGHEFTSYAFSIFTRVAA
jgi:hypothetical protein